jgi:hypothetical protein
VGVSREGRDRGCDIQARIRPTQDRRGTAAS